MSSIKEAYYFKHFCNARNDRKIQKARLQLGIEAYALYFMLLEVLREEKDFKYPLADLDVLAHEFNTSIQKLELIVTGYNLFTIDNENMFFSIAQLDGLKSWLEQKEINRLKGIKSGISRRNKIKAQIDELSDKDSTEPLLSNSSAVVELREEKKRKEKKDIQHSTTKEIKNFTKFVSYMRTKYVNREILNKASQISLDFVFMKDVELRVSKKGLLYNKVTQIDFSPEHADLIWNWLHTNQDQIVEIDE